VLASGGWLVLEVGAGQADAVVAHARSTERYELVEVVRDYAGIDRVVAARVGGGRKTGVSRMESSDTEGMWTRS